MSGIVQRSDCFAMHGLIFSAAANATIDCVAEPSSWQVVWQPQRPRITKHLKSHSVVIITRPHLFPVVDPIPSTLHASQELAVLSVYMHPNEGGGKARYSVTGCRTASGQLWPTASPSLCADLCVSLEEHLVALLGSLVSRHVTFVQPMDDEVDANIATVLTLYSLVASKSLHQRLSLVTWQPQAQQSVVKALAPTYVLHCKSLRNCHLLFYNTV